MLVTMTLETGPNVVVLFLIKLMNDPPDNFNITDYISFVSSSTRAATMNRIKRTIPLKPCLNSTRHFYFNMQDG